MSWLPPTVWRFEFLEDITALFDAGKISMNDLELAVNIATESGVVLGLVIHKVTFSWCPVYVELLLLDSITDSIKTHINGS
jgi:hypothetical protein